jgi:iron complex transport system substrate-binding protein
MSSLRIVSFLPAATEMIYLLGLGDDLVGRTFECDYPEEVLEKSVVIDCAIDLFGMTPKEIDAAVGRQLSAGKSLYTVDEERLMDLAPDLLVTQNLCQVCAASGCEVSQVLKTMVRAPKIIWQTPRTFDDVLDQVSILGRETGTEAKADAWLEAAVARTQRIAAATQVLPKVRVAFLEWVDPVFSAGHWIPRMLEWAGAEDLNSRRGTDSVKVTWEQIVDFRPEVVVVAPCGFKMSQSLKQAEHLVSNPGWGQLPAVKAGRVYAVDANAYFARPGPRLIDGVELLAHLIHPELFGWTGPPDAYAVVV